MQYSHKQYYYVMKQPWIGFNDTFHVNL